MSWRSVLTWLVVLAAAAGLLGRASVPAALAQAGPQAVVTCPEPAPRAPIDVCVDRGDGSLYVEGDPITICVTVTNLTAAPFRFTVRLTNYVDGVFQRVLFEEAMDGGTRCIQGVIGRPLGQETIVADLLRPDGSVAASDSVSYRSAPRSVPGATIAVSVDRGPGGFYLVGDPIVICVTLQNPTFAPLDVRVLNFVNGVLYRTIAFGRFDGRRCSQGVIVPPVGQETLRADAVDPRTGRIVASSSVGYLSR